MNNLTVRLSPRQTKHDGKLKSSVSAFKQSLQPGLKNKRMSNFMSNTTRDTESKLEGFKGFKFVQDISKVHERDINAIYSYFTCPPSI